MLFSNYETRKTTQMIKPFLCPTNIVINKLYKLI